LYVRDVISQCSVFICCTPPWGWPRNTATHRGLAIWLYSFVYNFCAFAGINIVQKSSLPYSQNSTIVSYSEKQPLLESAYHGPVITGLMFIQYIKYFIVINVTFLISVLKLIYMILVCRSGLPTCLVWLVPMFLYSRFRNWSNRTR